MPVKIPFPISILTGVWHTPEEHDLHLPDEGLPICFYFAHLAVPTQTVRPVIDVPPLPMIPLCFQFLPYEIGIN